MGKTRLVNLSLHYFLVHNLSYDVENDTTTTYDYVSYKLNYKNIVTTKPVTVYRNSQLVPNTEYKIFPVRGEIFFNDTQNTDDIITADFSHCFVNILQPFSEDEISPPLVAIENDNDSDRAIELGSNLSAVMYKFRIHVYGVNEGQRDDIADYIKETLKSDVYVWDFNLGFPVLRDGSINNEFDINNVINDIYFSSVRVQRNPLQSNDIIEKGRALITISGEII